MNTLPEELRRRIWVLVKDLELLAALHLAYFIVWRELRRCEREEAGRREYFGEGRSEI